MTPAMVIRPMFPAPPSENHMFPSGPAVMFQGSESTVGIGNSVMTPCGRDPTDLVTDLLDEPDVAVGTHRHAFGPRRSASEWEIP